MDHQRRRHPGKRCAAARKNFFSAYLLVGCGLFTRHDDLHAVEFHRSQFGSGPRRYRCPWFCAQSLVKDFLNGIFILLEDQYHVNDVVRIGDMAGVVEQVNLRLTVLRNLEG